MQNITSLVYVNNLTFPLHLFSILSLIGILFLTIYLYESIRNCYLLYSSC